MCKNNVSFLFAIVLMTLTIEYGHLIVVSAYTCYVPIRRVWFVYIVYGSIYMSFMLFYSLMIRAFDDFFFGYLVLTMITSRFESSNKTTGNIYSINCFIALDCFSFFFYFCQSYRDK